MSKTIDYQKKPLFAIDERIYDAYGHYICSISYTKRHVELIDRDDWDRKQESWLDYYKRTQPERQAEEEKRNQLAKDICIAYNEKFVKE